MKTIVRSENVSKVYQKAGSLPVHALQEVSVDIGEGQFVSIMGASGSGKSTLMNILGCLDRPTTGRVILDGDMVSELEDEELAHIRNRKIGFVFQTFNLLPRTSALENVELPLIYSDLENIEGKAEQALENVGLADRIHHHPSELSGGQQQRVAIARALVNDPEIILADEPTGNLDTRAGYEIMALFQDLNSQGRTIVVVTHEHDIARYASRIIKVADGRIVSDEVNPEVKQADQELSRLPGTEEVRT